MQAEHGPGHPGSLCTRITPPVPGGMQNVACPGPRTLTGMHPLVRRDQKRNHPVWLGSSLFWPRDCGGRPCELFSLLRSLSA